MFPYEVYFYSSGGIEEGWGPKDLLTNRMTAILGFGPRLAARDLDPRQLRAAVRPGQCRPADPRHGRARGRDPVRQDGA